MFTNAAKNFKLSLSNPRRANARGKRSLISLSTQSFSLAAAALLGCCAYENSSRAASDWPQWRGPGRNGLLTDSVPLAEQWPAKGLPKLWESEAIPSNDEGGHGSVVVAGGRVYAALVWHTDVPSETRTIDDLVLRKLDYQSIAGWPKATIESMEKARLALSPQVVGDEFDKYLKDWLEKNLDAKKRQTTAGFVRTRFQRRADAFPLEAYDKLQTVLDKRFPNQAALEQWVNEQNFGDKVKKEILTAVPPTMRVAEDAVICVDLANGKTVWKFTLPGEVVSRNASSTPCVADGRVYAIGSTHVYAVDAATGKQVWAVPSPAKGPAGSPLVVDGVLVLNAGKLTAFDAATGKSLWIQAKAGGGNSSPAAWKSGGKTVVVCNGKGTVAGVDLQSGEVLWTTPGGGDSTPAIVGDTMAVQTANSKIGVLVGKLSAAGFAASWNFPYDPLRNQASLLIIDQNVYLLDDNVHHCFDLATGKELWNEKVAGMNIASPVCADGKIFVLTSGGNKIAMVKPSPEKRIQLGVSPVQNLACPSPAIADGKLLLRGKKGITCYSLTAKAPEAR